MDATPVVVGSLSALAILAGHWFPWRRLLGRDLHRTEADTYGVTSICAPVLAAFALASEGWTARVLACAVLGACLSTLASKALDAAIERVHRIKDLEDRLSYGKSERVQDDPEN